MKIVGIEYHAITLLVWYFYLWFLYGSYEEMNYRFLMLEGLKHTKNDISMKILYTMVSSVLFGLLHAQKGRDISLSSLYNKVIKFYVKHLPTKIVMRTWVKAQMISVPLVF